MANSDERPSRFKLILDSLRKLLEKKPPTSPGDPYAYAMAPLRRGPKGRSGAVFAEIEDDADRSYPPRRA